MRYTNIARQPLWITIVIFTLLLGLFRAGSFASPQPPYHNPAPFGGAVNSWLSGSPFVGAAVSVILIYATMLLVTRTISRNLVFPARTYTYIILYLIVGYGFYIQSDPLPVAVAAWLIAKGSEYLALSFRRAASFRDSFRSGFVLGLAPLFYAPAAVFLLLLLAAMPLYMRSVRETVVALTGFMLPLFAYSYVMWGIGDPFMQPAAALWETITANGTGITFDARSPRGIMKLAAAALTATTILLSLGAFALEAKTMRTRAFRIYLFFVFFLIVSAGAMFLPCASPRDLPILALPASVVGSLFFSRHPGIPSAVIYLLLLLSIAGANIPW